MIAIPNVEGTFGFEILIGTRFSEGVVELSYARSTHDVTWLGAKSEAAYNMLNLDYEFYFLRDKPTQPFLLLGFSFPWLVVKDGSATATSAGDATFRGVGLNLGGGLAYYLLPTISIAGEAVYRLMTYTSATGVSGESKKIEDGFWGHGLNLNVGMKFTFWQR